MQILLTAINFLLLILLTVALFNALTSPRLSRAPLPENRPSVSLLVPACDCDMTITACLRGLLAQDYPNIEILVLAYGSTGDDIHEVVQWIAQEEARLRLIAGQSRPQGWTDFNWACHQLAAEASGDVLIFTRADILHTPEAVHNTIGWIEGWELDLATAFPQRVPRTFRERLISPVLELPLYGFIPTLLYHAVGSSLFAVANDGWMAFTRNGYDALGGHAAVKSERFESAELFRNAKARRLKALVLAGTGVLFASCEQALHGTSDEITGGFYGFTRGSSGTLPAAAALLLALFVLPYALLALPVYTIPALFAISLNIAFRFVIAVNFKQPLIDGILLHPFGVLLTLFTCLNPAPKKQF